jgi:hypothetical protein
LVLAIIETLKLTRPKGKTVQEEGKWELSFIPNLFAEKVYLVPEGRAPPFMVACPRMLTEGCQPLFGMFDLQCFQNVKGEKTMKNKHFLLFAVVALLGIIVTLNYTDVLAQQQEETIGKQGERVEFTDSPDREAEEGTGGWGLNGPDALQVVYTEPADPPGGPLPKNSTFDFGPSGEIDALANGGDLYLYELIDNNATLIISFQGDPGANAVWYETPQGARNVQWTQLNLVNEVAGHRINDLDALEVHGPRSIDDADFYSESGDPGGVSVKTMAMGNYINRWQIFSACSTLGYTGDSSLIDLDGLMVFERKGILGNKTWDTSDVIIFSIRNTKPVGNWDGGEIVVLRYGPPRTQDFLFHGGQTWNTAFVCSTAFGVHTEEVDAIEALRYDWPHPVLTEWGLIILVALLLASTVYIMLKRKKVRMA